MIRIRKKQVYGGANYVTEIPLINVMVFGFIALLAGWMIWAAFTGNLTESPKRLEEIRADRLIADVREEQFRTCLKEAAGLGVATTQQMNKCKEKYLSGE